MKTTEPGATTSYTLALSYMTPEPVGSLDMLFCISPIPYEPCVVPPGLDVSNAELDEQLGETGFSIQSKNTNHIVLTRPPSMIMSNTSASTYTFSNIKNPTDIKQSFSIRLRSHASTDATGPLIDFGSVKGQVGMGIVLETQVPPMLIFCVAQKVDDDCAGTNGTFFTDMGDLSENTTLTAQSQMAVGTNASAGFAITVNGNSLTAGTNVIDGLNTPTNSNAGSSQFGINLVANDQLGVGGDPEGIWANAVPSPDYSQPNKYKYKPGDVIAYSPNVSLMKKFTVSYIVNASPSLRAGVYTTTINYIASGRF
ncbi:MAG: hypothetical protein ACOH18_00360 [Candidatus Saccharimonadaceae bacterium]